VVSSSLKKPTLQKLPVAKRLLHQIFLIFMAPEVRKGYSH